MKRLNYFLIGLLGILPVSIAAPAQETGTVYEDVNSLTGCDAMRRLATRIPKECVKKKKYDPSVLGPSRGTDFRSMMTKKMASQSTEDWVPNTPSGAFSTRVLQFEVNSTTLSPQGKELLYEVETALLADPTLFLRIEGHTDSAGSDDLNQRLSDQRVAAVISQFDSKVRSRLIGQGFGEKRPLPSMPSTDPYNRRVEMIRVDPSAATQ
jgi:outer membrane protein OmpA-like peptidoglycan-associated protein